MFKNVKTLLFEVLASNYGFDQKSQNILKRGRVDTVWVRELNGKAYFKVRSLGRSVEKFVSVNDETALRHAASDVLDFFQAEPIPEPALRVKNTRETARQAEPTLLEKKALIKDIMPMCSGNPKMPLDFIRIHKVREAYEKRTGLKDFDHVLKRLMAEYTIEIHGGNPAILTKDELNACYKDPTGLYITMTYWGE